MHSLIALPGAPMGGTWISFTTVIRKAWQKCDAPCASPEADSIAARIAFPEDTRGGDGGSGNSKQYMQFVEIDRPWARIRGEGAGARRFLSPGSPVLVAQKYRRRRNRVPVGRRPLGCRIFPEKRFADGEPQDPPRQPSEFNWPSVRRMRRGGTGKVR